jgi:putative addiction module killer protein
LGGNYPEKELRKIWPARIGTAESGPLPFVDYDGESWVSRNIDKNSIVLHKGQSVAILQTSAFRAWLGGLRDGKARLRIDDRLKRLASGNAGDTKSVGGGVQELRMRFGPGYRVYYKWCGEVLVLLLTGGDKDSQVRDIAKAKQLAKEADDGIDVASF